MKNTLIALSSLFLSLTAFAHSDVNTIECGDRLTKVSFSIERSGPVGFEGNGVEKFVDFKLVCKTISNNYIVCINPETEKINTIIAFRSPTKVEATYLGYYDEEGTLLKCKTN